MRSRRQSRLLTFHKLLTHCLMIKFHLRLWASLTHMQEWRGIARGSVLDSKPLPEGGGCGACPARPQADAALLLSLETGSWST